MMMFLIMWSCLLVARRVPGTWVQAVEENTTRQQQQQWQQHPSQFVNDTTV
jgi:hypothetical protein